jgi:hypothetical protein
MNRIRCVGSARNASRDQRLFRMPFFPGIPSSSVMPHQPATHATSTGDRCVFRGSTTNVQAACGSSAMVWPAN